MKAFGKHMLEKNMRKNAFERKTLHPYSKFEVKNLTTGKTEIMFMSGNICGAVLPNRHVGLKNIN